MPDDKRGRVKQARDAENRRRRRDVLEELERSDETEPPVEETDLADFESELDAIDFPATGTEVVDVVGDHEIESADGTYTIEDLVPETGEEAYDAPADVRARIQRPTVAAAMKRVVEASQSLAKETLTGSQREAYEKTFRELRAIDVDDEDGGVQAISDWIVERIREKETLPGSRDVRKRAAEFCRENGYDVRNDEWLGV